jgi:hypothetical protein
MRLALWDVMPSDSTLMAEPFAANFGRLAQKGTKPAAEKRSEAVIAQSAI